MANEVTIHVKAKDDASKTMANVGKSAKGMAVGAATAALAVGAVLVKAMMSASAAARESQKVQEQTNAVLISTGGAAKVYASHVTALANSISRKTGIDDEAIQSSENLLLTFTRVRNEAGKGNKVFDQATQVITDMSVALNQDLKSSSIQVGKALNDPIKGITALTRVGVTFDEKTKEQIKTLVKHGKTLEAQKIILHELKTEFGGSAKAAATWGDKAKVAAGNIQESFGGLVNKTFKPIAKWFVKTGAPAIQDFFSEFEKSGKIDEATFAIQDFLDSIDKKSLEDSANSILAIGTAMGKVSKVLGKWNKDNGENFSTFGVNLQNLGAAFTYWKAKALDAMDTVASAMAKLHLIPQKFADAVHDMRVKADNDVNILARDINRKKIMPKIKADKREAEQKIKDIDQKLKHTDKSKAAPLLKARDQASAVIRRADGLLNQLDGKSANIWIRTHRVTYYGTKGKPPTNPKGDKKASGGIAHAAEGGMRGNQVLVGEEGPEIVDLPFGSHVNSNADSQRIMGQRGGGQSVTFNFNGPVYGGHDALVRALVDLKRRGQLDVVLR